MNHLRIIIPASVTAVLTVGAIFFARWLVGLVPPGEWSDLVKAGVVVFVVACALITIAWSAYFTHIIRRDIEVTKS